jgi:AmmeMemoRadiSam system protein B
MFYPADPAVLTQTVDELMDGVQVPDGDALATAYVVPHAGYRYSGPTAAHVYARLRRHAERLGRVVVLGPAHRVPLWGAAVPVAARWRTPLGVVDLDTEMAERLAGQGLAAVSDAPHEPEHSIEVQIPFLQRVRDEKAPLVAPVCVGQCPAEEVAAIIDEAAGADALVLCSTDLSHYLTEARARQQDAATATAIVDLAPERVALRDACGVFALRGLLHWARERGCHAELLDLCTSADTGGTPDRVVGYCAAAVGKPGRNPA